MLRDIKDKLLIFQVWLATDKETGVNYAIKKMLKSHLSKEANKKSVMNERNVLSKCNHPNIVKLYKAFRDDEYFCMIFAFFFLLCSRITIKIMLSAWPLTENFWDKFERYGVYLTI